MANYGKDARDTLDDLISEYENAMDTINQQEKQIKDLEATIESLTTDLMDARIELHNLEQGES